MAESFPINGNIDPKSFPFLLMDLHRQGATGSLKVEGPSYPKALYYRSGRILFGSSNDPRDQLGAILIENGKITAEQLAEVNTKVGPGNPLAKILAESGFVSQRELGEAARIKVERILSDIIGYTSGGFEFEDGVLPKGAVDLKLATEKLVLAAVRRIADRAFVLRHLEGLEVVLAVRPGADLSEVRADASDLPSQLNGHRTLKEAARLARLDEFDAAKIACGFLFLGLVERSGSGSDAAVSADPELDLAATAAMAFEDSGSGGAVPAPSDPNDDPFFASVGESPALDAGDSAPPFPMPEAEPFSALAAQAPEPDGFLAPEPAFLASEPAFLAPDPEPEAFLASEPDEPQTLPGTSAFRGLELDAPAEPAPALASEPDEPLGFAIGPELETTALPVMEAPASPPDTGQSSFPQADFSAEPMVADASEMGPEPVTPSRPSKEDLAALDALLNPATTSRPLEPARAPSKSGKWEPQFQSMAKPRRPTRPQVSPVILIALAAGAIALVAGGSWYYLNQVQATPVKRATVTPPSPSPVAATALPVQPSPIPSASADPASPSPGAQPSAAPAVAATPPPASPLPQATPTPRPTPPPKPVATPAVTALDNGPVTEARSLMRKGSFGAAAKGFAANVKAATASPFTIQLLVACSNETVQKALERVTADDLYILPVSYKGKSCNRICFGLYADEARADSAIASLPEYFRQNGATPKVVKTTTLLR
jgi:septal ring-binding cell division protein DamX